MDPASAISSVTKRLGELLVQESLFLHGVSDKVEEMQIELELMQVYIENFDRRGIEDKILETWVTRIREAAYDAEAVIEIFALKVASRRRGSGIQAAFKRCAGIFNEAVELHKVGSEIETIKTRISQLTRCLETYGIKHVVRADEGSSSVRGRQRHWRPSYSHIVEEDIVGLDRHVPFLVAELANEDNHNRVVFISGMGGLGKTTLAKKVYHHAEIRRHFDAFAWSTISQQCQPNIVLEGILFELISPSKGQRDEILKYRDAELSRKLCEVQQQKKCLVILDGVCTTTAWDSLQAAFPIRNATGSRILLTTRNMEVAVHVDERGFLYEPPRLTSEQSWYLLQKKAFRGKADPDFMNSIGIEMLGRQMVVRCEGLPLAILVLGGILATKHTLKEWETVHENILYFQKGEGWEPQQIRISEVLALSYQELPYQLRPCFLFLGLIPEGVNISTRKLARMWVAEGILSSMQCEVMGEKTLEEVAEDYLGELINRSMVQVGERGSTGRVKSCRLHDLMRDLCFLKANEENGFNIDHIPGKNVSADGSLSSISTISKPNRRIRRLSVHLSKLRYGENISWKHVKAPHLWSLLFFNAPVFNHFKVSRKVFSEYKLLKILDLEECEDIRKLPSAIGNLIHLRYLSVKIFCTANIPSSIGNLRCLQTLILRIKRNYITVSCGRLKAELTVKVPNVIWKLEQLRHLHLPMCMKKSFGHGKLRLGNLWHLQTLENFDAEAFNVKELEKLGNLRKLEIRRGLRSIKELKGIYDVEAPFEEMDLQGLLSSCHKLYKLFLEGKIKKLPAESFQFQFPPNLTKLTLKLSKLEEDPMPTLEKLPNLTVLHLLWESFIEKEMKCSAKGFPQLKSLLLWGLENLEDWRVGEEAMPNLSQLQIGKCRKLKMVPDGLRFITTLKELKIIDMPEAFRNRLIKEGGEDFHKAQHVPSIIIIQD